MTIPALPAAPALSDSPEVFNTKAFAFVAALDGWGTAANATASAVDADAAAADADAATATTQAGIATTKANEAAASALDANSSELAAQAAQTAAELAATNAAASYDSFDDRYLGAKSSDPTVDNDGGALIIGALYFNTTDQKMKVYATLGWKDAGSAVNGTARRQSFTATAGQTSFTVTDGYDAGFVDVFLNGVKLVNGTDVTVTSGTAVVLASGAAAGDSIDVIAYGAFVLANSYTKGEVDAFAVKLTGDQTIAGVKTFSSKAIIEGLTVGKGAGSIASNTAVGASALASGSLSGGFNTGVGVNTLTANTSGGNSSAFGYGALSANTTGALNTAGGVNALSGNTTGGSNTAWGVQALTSNTTASNNTAVGYQAGYNLTTGHTNCFIGYGTATAATTGVRNVSIGDRRLEGQDIFNLTTENDRAIFGHNSITNAYVKVAWTVTSDARDKTDVQPMQHGLAFVQQLKPVSYRWKTSREDATPVGTKRYGFLAQEIMALEGDNPVIIDNEKPEHLKYQGEALVPVLVKAIQELKAEFDAYKEAHP